MRILPGKLVLAVALASSLVGAPASAGEPLFEQQTLYKQGDFGHACFRIPAIVKAASGDVLAFAEGRVKDCGDD